MPRFTCTKVFAAFPFAHRAPNHAGHCSLIHGHNWDFEFTFAAKFRDANGFVLDFGSLANLKAWLNNHFDHTLVLNEGDPLLQSLQKLGDVFALPAKIVKVPDCSSEGLAGWLHEGVGAWVARQTENRVRVIRTKVTESPVNSATYESE